MESKEADMEEGKDVPLPPAMGEEKGKYGEIAVVGKGKKTVEDVSPPLSSSSSSSSSFSFLLFSPSYRA